MAGDSGFRWRVWCGVWLLLLAQAWPVLANTPPKPLIVTNSKAWQPFSYLNEEGEPDGLLIDLWREYGRVTGRPIQFKLVDWQASLDLVRNGQADVHGGLLWSPERNLVYDYGQALSHVDSQLFFANSLRGSDVNYYLLHESVGVVTGATRSTTPASTSPPRACVPSMTTTPCCVRPSAANWMLSSPICR